MPPPKRRNWRPAEAGGLGATLLLAFGCAGETRQGAPGDPGAAVEELVAAEEWIVSMGSALAAFAGAIEGAPLLPAGHPDVFAADFQLRTGAAEQPPPVARHGAVAIRRWEFGAAGDGGRDGAIWSAAGGAVGSLSDGKFGITRGDFSRPDRRAFRATLTFTGSGRAPDGGAVAFETVQEVDWVIAAGATPPSAAGDYLVDPADWRISSWRTLVIKLTSTPRRFFEEVTDRVIPDPADRALATVSGHSKHLDSFFSEGKATLRKEHGRHFMTDATAQHPALSVVDIDGDGRDDLYVCVRWGRNLLFRDRGDGTFEEVAGDYGLDIEGLTAAAIFADFDNDGDQDAFLGRTLERSLYLRNDGGTFTNQSTTSVAVPLPYLTTSLAAADYNGDGLLDIYLSTYGFAEKFARDAVARDFLTDLDPGEVEGRFVSPARYEPFLDLPGPPNLLLVNEGGGRFARSPLDGKVEVWRETLQSTWADFDGDGDMDLYVCNDFAPDQLFRNEGGEDFTDVTTTLGDERMLGFGMGASFGDFDNDLDLDLYVSNMYSKAGLRITDRQVTRDRRIRWSAEGNRLFVNERSAGYRLFGDGEGDLPSVAKADWSWGGQFLDIDNDRNLDLYVPNGYFTAPEAFAAAPDL